MPKILLVEDNEINRDMLSRRLARKGYKVAIAADGAEAVAKTQSERPDLVLMDLHIPVLDGWQATQQIKANPQTQMIPVIALTADAMAGEREKAIAVGCDDYDTKPVDLPQLVAKITRLLAVKTSSADTPNPFESDQKTPFHLHLQRLLRTRLRHQDFDPPLYSIIGYCDLLLDSINKVEYSDTPETFQNDIQKILASSEQLQQLIHAVLNPALVEVQQQEANLFAPILRREMLTPLSTIVGYCEILLEESPAAFRPDLDRIYMSAQNLLSKVNNLDSLVERHIEFMQADDANHNQDIAPQDCLQQTSLGGLPLANIKDSRVLVIDNDAYNCALLSRHLENYGLQVAVAATDKLATEAIAQASYDLILLELNLSENSEPNLLAQIQNHSNSQDTPVLIMAAADERTAIMRGIATGATDYLMRPYQSIMLITKVARHLECKQLKSQHKALVQQVAMLEAKLSQQQPATALSQPAPCAPSETQSTAAAETHPPQVNLPTKILLVEDNELNADMLSRRLQRAGFEIALASDGAQGVEKAISEQPQVILMDIGLPIIDGCEATRQLKADARTAQIPVIALTAHAMAGDRDKAIAAGCDDYDTKPIDLPRLLSKIENCLLKGAEEQLI